MEGLITIKYRVGPSTVAGAGKGFFLGENVKAGRVLIAPGHVTRTASLAEVFSDNPPEHVDTSVVWYEDQCVLSPGYPDDFFINHSFAPNALWHLGFTFALRDLIAGEELFLDYRHLVAPNVALEFRDGATGREIIGYSWKQNLRESAKQVLALAEAM